MLACRALSAEEVSEWFGIDPAYVEHIAEGTACSRELLRKQEQLLIELGIRPILAGTVANDH